MKQVVHWKVACAAILVTAMALTAAGRLWLGTRQSETFAFFVASIVLLTPVLALYLLPLYQPALKRMWKLLRATQWTRLSVACVILAVGVGVIGAGSYLMAHKAGIKFPPSMLMHVIVHRGEVGVGVSNGVFGAAPWDFFYETSHNPTRCRHHYRYSMFGSNNSFGVPCSNKLFSFGWMLRQGTKMRTTYVGFPFWVPMLLLAMAPGRAIWRGYRMPEQETVPTCQKCSYNLTGNVSGKCPECGTVIED